MKTPDIGAAQEFMWRNARLVDRLRFEHLFRGGSPDPVVAALRPYQNPDGGFGQAFEPDFRGPVSQPLTVWGVLLVLDEVDRFDDPMVGRACDYLQTITRADGGVPFVLKSLDDYPRAPWWMAGDDSKGLLLPTGGLAGVLHKRQSSHPWLSRATPFCWQRIEAIEQTSPYEARAALAFLDHAPDRARAEAAFARLGAAILAQKLVELDPDAPGEVHGPLDYAPHPECLARRLFADDVIEAHLDAMVARQRADGGWMFNWKDWNPGTTIEWRGFVTVEWLKTLRAYGRLP